MKHIQNWKNDLVEMKRCITSKGFSEAFKQYRWKLITVIVVYYLIRDTILYIVLPLSLGMATFANN